MLRLPRFFVAALGLSATLASPAVAQSEPVFLEPAGEWAVDFGVERCVLTRNFGPENNRHALFFQQWAPSADFSFTASGPAFERYRSRRATYVSFQPGGRKRRTEPFVGKTDGLGRAVIYSSFAIDPDDLSRDEQPDPDSAMNKGLAQLDLKDAGTVKFISFRQGKRTVQFNVNALRDAFEVMNVCTQSLVEDWGLDVEKHLTATRRAHMKNFDAIARRVASNYPRDALNRGEQAILRVRVMIDENGVPTDCFISDVTRTERLDSPACRPLMQGTYVPALDADGNPFASYFTTSIIYLIGEP